MSEAELLVIQFYTVEAQISKTKAEELKAFHRLLFGVMGKVSLDSRI